MKSRNFLAVLFGLLLVPAMPKILPGQTCSGSGCSTNQDSPVWSGVMLNDGQTQVDYFKYFNADTMGAVGVVETAQSTSPMLGTSTDSQLVSTFRPEYTYLFSHVARAANANGTYEYGGSADSTEIIRGVCKLSDQSTDFGDYSVFSNLNSYPTTPPTEFNESRLESGLKGINVLAAFDGNVLTDQGLSAKGSAIETFYYHDQQCTFGGHEYGFFKDVAKATSSDPGTIYFYYSDHTNCAANVCNASDGVTDGRGADYSITSLSPNSQNYIKYYFSAYFIANTSAPHGYIIRVQVVDPYTFALETCANAVATTNVSGYDLPVTQTNNGSSTIAAPMASSDTTISIADLSTFPASFPYVIQVDSEQMQLTDANTVIRGYNSTTPVTHAFGAPVTTVTGPCTFDITPPSWFRADLAGNSAGTSNGYLFGGIQLVNNPDTVGNTPGLWISSFSVGK